MKMGRRLRCSSVTYRFRYAPLLPPVRLGPPCRRPILIATNYLLFRGQDTETAYLIDSAGTNSVCVAELFPTNEPLIAKGAGRRDCLGWYSMVGNRLCLGARSPCTHGTPAAIDCETGPSGDRPKRLGANESRKCYCPSLIVQATGLPVWGKTACY